LNRSSIARRLLIFEICAIITSHTSLFCYLSDAEKILVTQVAGPHYPIRI